MGNEEVHENITFKKLYNFSHSLPSPTPNQVFPDWCVDASHGYRVRSGESASDHRRCGRVACHRVVEEKKEEKIKFLLVGVRSEDFFLSSFWLVNWVVPKKNWNNLSCCPLSKTRIKSY